MREPMTDEAQETLEMLRRVLASQGYRIIGTCGTCRHWQRFKRADRPHGLCKAGVNEFRYLHETSDDFGCTRWQAREDGG